MRRQRARRTRSASVTPAQIDVPSVAVMSRGECAACLSLAGLMGQRGNRADNLAAPCKGVGIERTEAFECLVEDFTPLPSIELLKSLPVPAGASYEPVIGRWLPMMAQPFEPDPCRPQAGTGEQPPDVEYASGGARGKGGHDGLSRREDHRTPQRCVHIGAQVVRGCDFGSPGLGSTRRGSHWTSTVRI